MITNELWNSLEKEATQISGSGILKRMISLGSKHDVYIGVQRPTLNRVLMLEVPKNSVPSKELIPESKGFKLNIEVGIAELDESVTCVLSSLNKSDNEIFSAMSKNIYESIASCDSKSQVGAAFFNRLRQWQLFFERSFDKGLSAESQRGLYGELVFIKDILFARLNHSPNIISHWTGPKNRQHDFQFIETAIEVKTSSAKQHQKLFISSEQQLDTTLVKNLFLYHVSLSIIDGNVETLPKIIDDIRRLIENSGAAKSLFNEALLLRGYIDDHSWRYADVGYSIRETNLFHVVAEFPKITEKNLPIGIGDVTYSISVSECKRYSVPFDILASFLGLKNE